MSSSPPLPKQPRLVLDEFEQSFGTSRGESCSHPIFAFPPNRDTLGGTAYLIVEKAGNILIDCPAWDEPNQQFLQTQGGVRSLFLTHRGGIGKVGKIQDAFKCDILIQEQEAYLLPGRSLTSFQHEFSLNSHTRAIWTAGHSPGSSCLYLGTCGGVLFSGRHLLPDRQGKPVALRTAKTFHWKRQIRQVRSLLDQFTPDTLRFICPGASIGFLRGQSKIDNAYEKLAQLDLETCLSTQPLL
ncbi:MBL fold metallo-hydrolase [Myxacorys almedinensis]|uniref:MBL fold metallo-hydrolase n=1 Tax=Myxacorys almedinensis TaxID=2651157 RepID=UPI0030835B21